MFRRIIPPTYNILLYCKEFWWKDYIFVKCITLKKYTEYPSRCMFRKNVRLGKHRRVIVRVDRMNINWQLQTYVWLVETYCYDLIFSKLKNIFLSLFQWYVGIMSMI